MPSGVRRRDIRLPTYDYRTPGPYFFTICAHRKYAYFGSIVGMEMQPNAIGAMVEGAWYDIPLSFPEVQLDVFVLMPNHVHGVLMLDADTVDRNARLGDIVGWFKTVTTNRYIHGVRAFGWPRFDGKVWQPNYFEHIVRNDADLDRIRGYVVHNPETWDKDALYTR